MSRIGKQPIVLPKGVKAVIAGQLLKVEGPKGKLERELCSEVRVREEDGSLVFERVDDSKPARAKHGLERALARNMVEGVSAGFAKELALVGVGYRADTKGSTLTLSLGYSHPIDFHLPKGVTATLIREGRDTFIRLEAVDKQLLGQTAAQIRSLREPEPYKGKGVRYREEQVRTKAGKTGKK